MNGSAAIGTRLARPALCAEPQFSGQRGYSRGQTRPDGRDEPEFEPAPVRAYGGSCLCGCCGCRNRAHRRSSGVPKQRGCPIPHSDSERRAQRDPAGRSRAWSFGGEGDTHRVRRPTVSRLPLLFGEAAPDSRGRVRAARQGEDGVPGLSVHRTGFGEGAELHLRGRAAGQAVAVPGGALSKRVSGLAYFSRGAPASFQPEMPAERCFTLV